MQENRSLVCRGSPSQNGFFMLSRNIFTVHGLLGDTFKLFLWMSSKAWGYQNSQGTVRASIWYMHDQTDISISTVIRAIKRLQSLELIKLIERNFKKGSLWAVSPIAFGGKRELCQNEQAKPKFNLNGELCQNEYDNINNNINININLSSINIINKFYMLFGLKPASVKKNKELPVIEQLLGEYDVEIILYSFEWLRSHYPDTNSITRLPFYMDQAVRAYEKEQEKSKKAVEEKSLEIKIQQEKQEIEKREQLISKIINELPKDILLQINNEASTLINATKAPKYLHEKLHMMKVREIVSNQFMNCENV